MNKPREKEKYQNLGIDKNNLNKWQKRFIREFVNDHGNAWRPLRGLWVEDVLEFIQKEIDSALSSQLKEVLELVQSNTEGTFTDDGGNDCWYIDKLVEAIKGLAEVEKLV